jgi:hypothetical protein
LVAMTATNATAAKPPTYRAWRAFGCAIGRNLSATFTISRSSPIVR